MNERESFVCRAYLRALRDLDADPRAAIARLQQLLGSSHRDIVERLARQVDSATTRDPAASRLDPVRHAAISIDIVREHGGQMTDAFWLVVERNLAGQVTLIGSLALASLRAQLVTFATALFAAIVAAVYLIFVLPQLAYLFSTMHAVLPGFTRAILTGPSPVLIFAALGAVAALAAITLVRPGWLNDVRADGSRLPAIIGRALTGGRALQDNCALLFVDYAAAFIAAGVESREALAAASRAAGVYTTVNFGAPDGRIGEDALSDALLAAERLGHLSQELDAQHELRLNAVLATAEQAQLRAGLAVRALLYAIVAALLIAMYLPIFRIGAIV